VNTSITRSYVPLSLDKDRKCPGDHMHFRGAAREIYKYLRLLACNHGGFVFPSLKDVAKHTKKWNKERTPFSERQTKRVIRDFIVLGILEKRSIRTPHGAPYSGWQFREHDSWAESGGGFCELKHWEQLQQGQENKEQNGTPNVPDNVPANVSADVPNIVPNVTPNVTLGEDILLDKTVNAEELQEGRCGASPQDFLRL
jgi:hypothetical protein